jgi:hypothetical protein
MYHLFLFVVILSFVIITLLYLELNGIYNQTIQDIRKTNKLDNNNNNNNNNQNVNQLSSKDIDRKKQDKLDLELNQQHGVAIKPTTLNEMIKELFFIGVKNRSQLYDILTNNDIFDTFVPPINRSFYSPCSDNMNRLDIDITNKENLQMFLNSTTGSFIFYQHLRKAGGTGFCDLAKSNLNPRTIPPYYCMPDQVSIYLSL